MRKAISAFSFILVMFNGLEQPLAQDMPRPDRVPPGSLVEDFAASKGLTAGDEPREVNDVGVHLIKHFEGWEPWAYNDPVGYCTIGYGHLIALKRCEDIVSDLEGKELTIPAGEKLLETDSRSARAAVSDLVTVELDENQFSALSSFVFNIGKSRFATSTMLILLNNQDYEAAAAQFTLWRKAKGRVLAGLVDRRACETALFNGSLQLVNGKFDLSQCKSAGLTPPDGELIDILVGE